MPTPEITVFSGPDNSGPIILNAQTMVIDYGSVVQGTDITQFFTIQNTGASLLNISSITVSGTDYNVSSSISAITIGTTETFTVTLSGANAGTFNATISIASDDVDKNPFTFPITGIITSPEINVYDGLTNASPSLADAQVTAVDFGSATQDTDVTQSFAIENTGTSTLNVSSITVVGSDYGVNSTISAIAIGTAETFIVTLSGTNAGIFNTTLTIVSDDADENPFTFDIVGTVEGVNIIDGADNTGVIIIDNQDIDVGSTVVNVDIDKIFVIENLSGSNNLTINSIISDSPTFEVIDPPTSIAPNEFVQFIVRLVALEVGVYEGDISVSTSISDFIFRVTGEVLQSDQSDLNIYNVVTPNGDDVHDFLKIGNITNFSDNKVTIFNRWGDKVFELSGYDNLNKVFNGVSNTRSSKDLDAGNYYYAIDKGDGSKKETGFLLLIR